MGLRRSTGVIPATSQHQPKQSNNPRQFDPGFQQPRVVRRPKQLSNSMPESNNSLRGFEAGARVGANPDIDDLNPESQQDFTKPSQTYSQAREVTKPSIFIPWLTKTSPSTSPSSPTLSEILWKATGKQNEDKFCEAMEMTSEPDDGWARLHWRNSK